MQNGKHANEKTKDARIRKAPTQRQDAFNFRARCWATLSTAQAIPTRNNKKYPFWMGSRHRTSHHVPPTCVTFNFIGGM